MPEPPPPRQPLPLQYESRRPLRPLAPSTLPPAGPLARGLSWLAYRAGRLLGYFAVKPTSRRRS